MEQVFWHLAVGGVLLVYLGKVFVAFLSGDYTRWWEPLVAPLVLPLLLAYQAREAVLFWVGLASVFVLVGYLASVMGDLVRLVWSLL